MKNRNIIIDFNVIFTLPFYCIVVIIGLLKRFEYKSSVNKDYTIFFFKRSSAVSVGDRLFQVQIAFVQLLCKMLNILIIEKLHIMILLWKIKLILFSEKLSTCNSKG